MYHVQELSEDMHSGAPFLDLKFISENRHPKELFLSSDASAIVEHTKKVLVIEDGEVVHLKVPLQLLLIELFGMLLRVTYKIFALKSSY